MFAKGRGIGGRGSLRGTVGLLAVTGLLFLTPAVSGAGVVPSGLETLTAPYHGWAQYLGTHNFYRCSSTSASSKVIKSGSFDFSLGVGGFSAQTAARSCVSGASSDGYTDQNLAVIVPLRFHHGHPTLFVNGTYALNASLALTAGTCSPLATPNYQYCDREARVDIALDAYFVDLTTSSMKPIGSLFVDNYSYNDTGCSYGTCVNSSSGNMSTVGSYSLAGNFSFSSSIGKKMVRTDKYALEFEVDGETTSECSVSRFALTGCSASASLNFATGGDGFVLRSIALS